MLFRDRRCACMFRLARALLAVAVVLVWEVEANQDAASPVTDADFSPPFSEFVDEVAGYSQLAQARDASLRDLQVAFTSARLAYKRVEYLVDFHYTAYNQLYINGTPFQKYDYESSGDLVDPQGFQRMEELLYLEDELARTSELAGLAATLAQRVTHLQKVWPATNIEPVNTLEAIRSGLVRVFALGLAGFDTPGSPNAMLESLVAFRAMQAHFAALQDGLSAVPPGLAQRSAALFDAGISQLEGNPDFNTFDRLRFLEEVVNPLYAVLLDVQLAAAGGFTQYKTSAQNMAARNLFAENFLAPGYYNQTSLVPLDNADSVALGHRLFLDARLSRSKDMSCASCHATEQAFTDGLATAITNQEGEFQLRNTPTLLNAVYATRQFWDMRAYDLERQVPHVADNVLEFDLSLEEAARLLSEDPAYHEAFTRIYGDSVQPAIQPRTISNALAAYVASLRSLDSAFDRYVRGETESLAPEARRGFNLFMGKAACGTCHFAPVFNGTVPPFYTETESEVLGVTVGFDPDQPVLDDDPGRSANAIPRDDKLGHFNRSFKTMTVRDVERTAPYMHNGSFETLEDVVEFYDLGGGAGMGLAVPNQTLASDALELSDQEKSDLVAFMRALNGTNQD